MSKYVVMATWDDVPHLTTQQKEDLWDGIPPYQRDARSKGVPQLGSGAIYPVAESSITVDPFEIPVHWPRAFGMDTGWNKTAGIWGAWDRESDTIYLYSEYYAGKVEPPIHADGFKARGSWIPGAADAAATNQDDGVKVLDIYVGLGLDIVLPNKAVEAGIYCVWQRLSTGRLKVFKTLPNWLGEFRLYRRDEKGKVVKERDHLMDAMRYLVMTGMARGITPVAADEEYEDSDNYVTGRNRTTGY